MSFYLFIFFLPIPFKGTPLNVWHSVQRGLLFAAFPFKFCCLLSKGKKYPVEVKVSVCSSLRQHFVTSQDEPEHSSASQCDQDLVLRFSGLFLWGSHAPLHVTLSSQNWEVLLDYSIIYCFTELNPEYVEVEMFVFSEDFFFFKLWQICKLVLVEK